MRGSERAEKTPRAELLPRRGGSPRWDHVPHRSGVLQRGVIPPRGGVPRRGLLLGAAGLLAAAALGGCARRAPVSQGKTVAFGFEDLTEGPETWRRYARRLNGLDVDRISLAVGRIDWVGFPGGPAGSAADAVERTGVDYVRRALDVVRETAERELEVTLVIDALVPRGIERDAELAGVNPDGEASDSFAGVAAIERGTVGEGLVDLAEAVASRYRPERIAFTELMFDDFTFSENDLGSYRDSESREDWPRTEAGDVDTGHPSLGRWRSGVLAGLLQRVGERLEGSGTAVDVDVRAPWNSPDGDRALSGHDYGRLLEAADRLVVWNYFGLNDRSPEYGGKVARSLHDRFGERFEVSIGLWADDSSVVSPGELGRALDALADRNAPSVSVTPASLMSEEHWEILAERWPAEPAG